MRIHGNYNLRFMKHHLRPSHKTSSMTSTMSGKHMPMLTTGGSVYSEQLNKTVTNMPELNKQFGGLLKGKKAKKVFLKL